MNETEKIVLIDGTFLCKEAKEILTSVLTTKINFHQMKNFSSHELFGKDDVIAKKRIPALKKEMQKVQSILQKAEEKNKHLIISSEIKIALTDNLDA
ncbi:hypothetical protein ACO2Q8_23860 [Larkinella sp. VNQ87]|uniref:hypothetical protein n=1 Tax=Larkinella sp. VNQ87 TaxID=3400921 RepID=UPI003C077BE7